MPDEPEAPEVKYYPGHHFTREQEVGLEVRMIDVFLDWLEENDYEVHMRVMLTHAVTFPGSREEILAQYKKFLLEL